MVLCGLPVHERAAAFRQRAQGLFGRDGGQDLEVVPPGPRILSASSPRPGTSGGSCGRRRVVTERGKQAAGNLRTQSPRPTSRIAGSYLPHTTNGWVGRVIGILTLTPYDRSADPARKPSLCAPRPMGRRAEPSRSRSMRLWRFDAAEARLTTGKPFRIPFQQ